MYLLPTPASTQLAGLGHASAARRIRLRGLGCGSCSRKKSCASLGALPVGFQFPQRACPAWGCGTPPAWPISLPAPTPLQATSTTPPPAATIPSPATTLPATAPPTAPVYSAPPPGQVVVGYDYTGRPFYGDPAAALPATGYPTAAPAAASTTVVQTSATPSSYQSILDWLSQSTLVSWAPNWGLVAGLGLAAMWMKNRGGRR